MVRTSPSWLKLTVASKDTVGINPNEWWTSRSTQLIWLNRSPWISMELKVHVSLSFRNFLVPTNQKSGCFNPAQKFNLFLSIFGWLSLVLNICTICIYIHIHNYQILCSMVKTCYMTIYIYMSSGHPSHIGNPWGIQIAMHWKGLCNFAKFWPWHNSWNCKAKSQAHVPPQTCDSFIQDIRFFQGVCHKKLWSESGLRKTMLPVNHIHGYPEIVSVAE